jgi:hypothetical protein
MDKMKTSANRWLLIGAVSALAIGTSACNKPATTAAGADATAAGADATAAPPAGNTMAADNSTATNSMSSGGGGAAPSQ